MFSERLEKLKREMKSNRRKTGIKEFELKRRRQQRARIRRDVFRHKGVAVYKDKGRRR